MTDYDIPRLKWSAGGMLKDDKGGYVFHVDYDNIKIALKLEQEQKRQLERELAQANDKNAPHKRVSRQIEAKSCQQWQPIKTAPKDGTDVIVLNKNGERFIASSTDGQNWYDGVWPIYFPSHWMPLPAPPMPDK